MLKHLLDQVSMMHFNFLLFLGFILFLGALGGKLFQKIKFPQVVGYIVIGIAIGQTGFHIISKELIDTMHPINQFALGIIGFMIGSELKIKVIKKYGKQFSSILIFESLTAFFIVGTLITCVGYFLFHDFRTAISVGLLLGAIASATAPAATTDVLWENKTKGPLTTMVLGLVAMDDGVALLLFAIGSSIASILLGNGETNIGLSIASLVYEIAGALTLGTLSGFLLSKLIKSFKDEERVLIFSLSSLLLLIGISQVLHLNMILCTMSAGFFISNFAPRKSEDTFHLIQKFSPPIYVLFFVLVGAELNISNITILVAILASLYLFGRVAGKFLGAYIGSKISKAPPTVKKYLGLCLMSQAGVAIGLSIMAEKTFSGSIGDIVIIVITTTTFIVQLAGPPLVKLATVKSGEAGLNKTEDDFLKDSKASDMMDSSQTSVQAQEKISKVLKIFSESDHHYFAVTDKHNKVQGIITLENLKTMIMNESLNEIMLAHDIMEPVVKTASIDEAAITIKEEIAQYKTPCIPILDKDQCFAGLVENTTIDKFISRKMWEMNQTLEALE